MKNMEENCEMIWKIWKKVVWDVKYGKYGRNPSWIGKRYGQYGRKASWIVKIYEKYGRNPSSIVKWYGKYGKKYWKDMENMEER